MEDKNPEFGYQAINTKFFKEDDVAYSQFFKEGDVGYSEFYLPAGENADYRFAFFRPEDKESTPCKGIKLQLPNVILLPEDLDVLIEFFEFAKNVIESAEKHNEQTVKDNGGSLNPDKWSSHTVGPR
jgi:hypothetical protein